MTITEQIIDFITRNRVSTTEVADAMGKVGVLRNVMPMTPELHKVGRVRTIFTSQGSNFGVHDQVRNVEEGEIVILSVKPQVLKTVIPQVRGHLRRQNLIISIVAGAPLRLLADGMAHASVVRAMPNTPGQIGQGITVWTVTEQVGPDGRDHARAILGALGQELFVDDEDYLDMATALSGTGPAYIFLFMEAMIDAGVHLGFSRRVASQLVTQTMAGSVAYARQSNLHVAELRNQVTSPGGTSAEAIYHLEKGGLRTVISRAVWAAYQRSRALGQGKRRDTLPENGNN